MSTLLLLQLSCQRYQGKQEYPGFYQEVSSDLPIRLTWTYESAEPIRVPPRSNQDTLVILESNGVFRGLDLETGKAQWEYDTGMEIGWPSSDRPYDVNDDLLVAIINNRLLTIIDAHNGKELWQIEVNSVSEIVPDILLFNNVVVISSPSVEPTTQGYLAGYDLNTRGLIFEKYYPPRSLTHAFRCPGFYQSSKSSEYTVCVSHYRYLDVIDFNPLPENGFVRVLGKMEWKFATLDRPYFREGFIFSVDSPNPAIQVIDVEEREQFALFESCEIKKPPFPIQSYEEVLLVSTGCDEFYSVTIDSIREDPPWVFHSPDELRSPFVKLGGDVGYFLTSKAEIIGVDLSTGENVGRFTTNPASLDSGRYNNDLVVQRPYLYAFLNGRQIFAFKEE